MIKLSHTSIMHNKTHLVEDPSYPCAIHIHPNQFSKIQKGHIILQSSDLHIARLIQLFIFRSHPIHILKLPIFKNYFFFCSEGAKFIRREKERQRKTQAKSKTRKQWKAGGRRRKTRANRIPAQVAPPFGLRKLKGMAERAYKGGEMPK